MKLVSLSNVELEVLSLACRHPIYRGDGSADTPAIERLAKLGLIAPHGDRDDLWYGTPAGRDRLVASSCAS